MSLKKIALGLAAATMVAAPVVAQSAMAPSVAPLSGDELGAEGSNSVILGLAAAAAIVGGIILLADGSDREVPISG